MTTRDPVGLVLAGVEDACAGDVKIRDPVIEVASATRAVAAASSRRRVTNNRLRGVRGRMEALPTAGMDAATSGRHHPAPTRRRPAPVDQFGVAVAFREVGLGDASQIAGGGPDPDPVNPGGR
jgi:hypothetical protein